MFNARIDASDLQRKAALLTDADMRRDLATAIADEAVIPEMAKEPFRATRPKAIFTSAKQRAFVIAAIRSGAIQVPYQRTGRIGDTQKQPTTNGIDVVATAPYSDLVRTRGQQAKIHAGVWPTDEDIAAKIESDTAELIGTAAVIQALDKAGLM